ncbi:hypothetical protein [Aquimarina litoralis]|uniref:hypothetical protein n=1 Tax=Aquimarina litoralis TaxID=584605 RepID=UPI0031E10522
MKTLKKFRKLTRQELSKVNGGTDYSAGQCENFIHVPPTAAMPEPGRYCLS